MSAAALTTAMMMFWVDALGREGGVPAVVFESWLGLGSGITSVPLGTGSIEVVSEGRAGVGEDNEDSEASVDEDDIETVGGGRGVLVVDRLVDVDVAVVEVVDGGEGAPGDVVLGNVPDVELTPLVVVGSVGRAIGVIGSVGRGSSVVAIERAQSESKRTTRDPARPGGAGVGVRASPTLGKEILENCLQRGVRVQCDACVMTLHAPPPIRFYGLIILFKENLVRHVAGLGCARRWEAKEAVRYMRKSLCRPRIRVAHKSAATVLGRPPAAALRSTAMNAAPHRSSRDMRNACRDADISESAAEKRHAR